MRPAKQSTARKLLRAATDAFSAAGFDATSTRAVADRAGVNIALIAYHFGGKDGLYKAVLDAWVSGMCDGINRELSGVTTAARRTDALVSVFLRYALIESPGVAALIARESVTAVNSGAARRTAAALKPLIELLDSLVPSCETAIGDGAAFLGLLLRLAAPMPSIDGDGAKGYHLARVRALALLRPAIGSAPIHPGQPKPEAAPKHRVAPHPTVDFVD